jgi:hypothetical protein
MQHPRSPGPETARPGGLGSLSILTLFPRLWSHPQSLPLPFLFFFSLYTHSPPDEVDASEDAYWAWYKVYFHVNVLKSTPRSLTTASAGLADSTVPSHAEITL